MRTREKLASCLLRGPIDPATSLPATTDRRIRRVSLSAPRMNAAATLCQNGIVITLLLTLGAQMMRTLSAARLAATRVREDARFLARTLKSGAMRQRAAAHLPNGVPMAWMAGLYRTPPIYCESGLGARFRDIDGNEYLDFNVADLSMSAGFGPQAIVAAVSAQVRRGAHFLLPTPDAVELAEMLSELVGLPYWQATLSATGANSEVIRIARIATGHERTGCSAPRTMRASRRSAAVLQTDSIGCSRSKICRGGPSGWARVLATVLSRRCRATAQKLHGRSTSTSSIRGACTSRTAAFGMRSLPPDHRSRSCTLRPTLTATSRLPENFSATSSSCATDRSAPVVRSLNSVQVGMGFYARLLYTPTSQSQRPR
jgi:hypothetical protein